MKTNKAVRLTLSLSVQSASGNQLMPCCSLCSSLLHVTLAAFCLHLLVTYLLLCQPIQFIGIKYRFFSPIILGGDMAILEN